MNMVLETTEHITETAFYNVSVISTIEKFSTLTSEWDDLFEKAGVKNLTLHSVWLQIWLECFPPQEIFIVTVRNAQGVLVGAAPMLIRKGSRGLGRKQLTFLQFIGTEPEVYEWAKILVSTEEDEDKILRCVVQAIQEKKDRWDVLDLRFCSDKRQLEKIQCAIQPVFQSDLSEAMSIPYSLLPPSLEGFRPEKKSHREVIREVNRKTRQFQEEYSGSEVSYRLVLTMEEALEHFEPFFQTHQEYWKARGVKSLFTLFPKLKLFYKMAFEYYLNNRNPNVGKIEFSVLKMGDRTTSFQLWFLDSGMTATSHLAVTREDYRFYVPGKIHNQRSFEEYTTRSFQTFSMGRGNESYKRIWAREKMLLWNLMVFRTSRAKFLWDLDQRLLSYRDWLISRFSKA